jgi:YaiO family outer membrane protein
MPSFVFASDRTTVEQQLKEKAMPIAQEQAKKKLYLSSDYEYGWVTQALRKGKWGVLTNDVMYSVNDFLLPYFEATTQDRFGQTDYTFDAGTYLKFKDASYLRSEIGFGDHITYVYQFQSRLEYQHRLFKNYFWQLGYRYLNYADNDVFIGYPGLVYYFGDNYITIFYNTSHTEGRGNAQWGTVKGNFSLTDRLDAWLGAAVGERLYDIQLLPPSNQYGYIAFCGFDFKIVKDLSLRLGFSYSKEKPSFTKRGLDIGLAYKF